MIRRLLLLAFAVLATVAAPHAQRSGELYVVQPGDTLYRISRASNMTVDLLRRLNPGVVDDVISVGLTLRLSDRVAVPAPRPTTGPPSIPGGPAQAPTAPSASLPPATGRPPAPAAAPPTAPAPPAGAVTHVVQSNDTLFRIAQRYGMSVAEVRRLNGLTGDAIQLGQRLTVVPAAGVTPPISGGVAVNTPPPSSLPNGPARVTTPSTAAPARPEPVRRAPPRQWSTTDTTVPADLIHFVEPGETLFGIAAAYGFSVDALIGQNALSTAPLVPGSLLYLPAPVDPSWAASRQLPDPSEAGLALVYPDVLSGRPTASGEAYDPLALTASHRDLPLGTILLVTNPASGRSTFVRVADRGPVSRAYLVELSAAAATALDLDPNAARRVELRQIP